MIDHYIATYGFCLLFLGLAPFAYQAYKKYSKQFRQVGDFTLVLLVYLIVAAIMALPIWLFFEITMGNI